MTEQASHHQESLFPEDDAPAPMTLEEAREYAAQAGLSRSWTAESAFDRGTLAEHERNGGGMRQDSATEELPGVPEPETPRVKPDGKGGSDGKINDSDLDDIWNNPTLPKTDDERKRARRQRAETSAELVDSDVAAARRLAKAGGNVAIAAALEQNERSKQSH